LRPQAELHAGLAAIRSRGKPRNAGPQPASAAHPLPTLGASKARPRRIYTRRMPSLQPTVLVIDDERHSVEAIRRTLEDDFDIRTAGSAEEALQVLEGEARIGNPDTPVDLILCDQRMPGTTGIAFLKLVRERWPEVVRVIISGHTDAEDIIAGINEAGIYQYVLKPWLPDHLVALVSEALEARRLNRDVRRLDMELRAGAGVLRARLRGKQAAVALHHEFDRLVRAPGSPLDEVCRTAQKIARYDLSVLIQGESGTGKELLARAIHYASPRTTDPFVMENCAAIPDSLLESELFGHRRGAFTGAHADHVGLFQRANGGTVFLDEIGDTSLTMQVKLLRVLQEGEVRPVGATQSLRVDVRIVAATHRDLEAEVRAGRFREDLYYRLAGVTVTLPALRERTMDLGVIVASILAQAATDLAKPVHGFAPEAMACMLTYGWPGNIRELRNEIYRAVALCDDLVIPADALSPKLLRGQAVHQMNGASQGVDGMRVPESGTLVERLGAIEVAILKESLMQHRWNKTRAAKALGLSRVGLKQKLVRLGLEEK